MSSARTSGHGLVVITKIIPLEEDCDIPMTNVISEVNKPTIHYQKVPEMTRLFQKAYPMQLGIVQIFLGIMSVALGVLVISFESSEFLGEVPLSLGIFMILSGSISAASHKGGHICLIKGTLALNIISSLLTLTYIGYFCWELTKQSYDVCEQTGGQDYTYWRCLSTVSGYKSMVNGMKGLLLVMAVFEFCVSTTISVFSAKAIRHADVHLVGNSGALTGASTDNDGTVALLTEEDGTAPASP